MKRRRSGNCAISDLTGSPLPPSGIAEVVDQVRAGDLYFDRLGKGPLRHAVAGAGLERKHRVVAGRPGVEQIGGTEVGLIARQRQARRRAVQPGLEIRCGVERQQHRHPAAPDAGEDRRGHGVELHQRRHGARIAGREPALAGKREGGRDRRPGVDLGSQLIEGRTPFDAHGRDRRRAELIGDSSGRTGEEQNERCQPTRDEPDSLRSQCVAPRRQCAIEPPNPWRARRRIRPRS